MQDRLKEIRERVAKATPGPWVSIEKGNSVKSLAIQSVAFLGEPSRNICSSISPKTKNAEFIANAPTDINYLLEALEEAQAENKRLESRCRQNQQKEYQRVYNDMAQYGQEADELEIKIQQLREAIINVKGVPCLEEWDHIYKIAGGEVSG